MSDTDTTDDEDASAVVLKDPAVPIAADAVYDPDAEPLKAWFAPFEPGTYRTGALGTPMSFTTTEALNTQNNGDGIVRHLRHLQPGARRPRSRVHARRRLLRSGRTECADRGADQWPNDDFLGWLENLHDGVIATEPVETTVNGFAAIRVDLSISDDIECGFLPGLCVGLLENNGQDIKALNKGASYRVWVVEQGDEDPLAIVATSPATRTLPGSSGPTQ